MMKKHILICVRLVSAVIAAGLLFFAGCTLNIDKPTTLEVIREAGILTVGISSEDSIISRYNPATKAYSGIEPLIAKRIAESIFQVPDKVRYIPLTKLERGSALEGRQVDMVISGFVINDERETAYNFSQPYYKTYAGVLVHKKDNINKFSDLNNKTIAVTLGSTSKNVLEHLALSNDTNIKFSDYITYADMKHALNSNVVQVICDDKAILEAMPDDNCRILPDDLAVHYYGVATLFGNDELAEQADIVIEQMKAEGLLYVD